MKLYISALLCRHEVLFPLLISGGLIEADAMTLMRGRLSIFPLLISGGLIEALANRFTSELVVQISAAN